MRRDDGAGVIKIKPVVQLAKIAPKPTTIPINAAKVLLPPKPVVAAAKTVREPDFSMLNKPPPLAFNLPKSAAYAPRVVNHDPLNDPPEEALRKLESEASILKEEVSALKWLAKRKEQEWNNIIELLKKKEETWLKVKRQADITVFDKGLHKIQSITPAPLPTSLPTSTVFPSPAMPEAPPPIQVLRASSASLTPTTMVKPASVVVSTTGTLAGGPRKVLVPVSQPLTPQAIQTLSSQGLLKSGGMTADGKRVIVVKKAAAGGITAMLKSSGASFSTAPMVRNVTTIIRPPGTLAVTKVVTASPKSVVSTGKEPFTPDKSQCGECKTKAAKFECSACSKMWYCSRECQEKNWSKHEHECGMTKAVIKEEIITE